MGLFKQMKDMRNTVEATPGMIAQAQQLAAQAQQMAAAQQAAAQQAQAAPAPPAAVAGPELEPIAGVSLELYADISRGLAEYGYDQSKAVLVAASKGVPAVAWEQAVGGWNTRIAAYPAIARQFNQLYTGR
jgi:hypothetical protein